MIFAWDDELEPHRHSWQRRGPIVGTVSHLLILKTTQLGGMLVNLIRWTRRRTIMYTTATSLRVSTFLPKDAVGERFALPPYSVFSERWFVVSLCLFSQLAGYCRGVRRGKSSLPRCASQDHGLCLYLCLIGRTPDSNN